MRAFARGVVWGLYMAGWSGKSIAAKVRKTDGTVPKRQSVWSAIAGAKKRGARVWRGEQKSKAGRPRKTTKGLMKKIRNLVFRHRGSAVVTVAFIKKRIREARTVSSL